MATKSKSAHNSAHISAASTSRGVDGGGVSHHNHIFPARGLDPLAVCRERRAPAAEPCSPVLGPLRRVCCDRTRLQAHQSDEAAPQQIRHAPNPPPPPSPRMLQARACVYVPPRVAAQAAALRPTSAALFSCSLRCIRASTAAALMHGLIIAGTCTTDAERMNFNACHALQTSSHSCKCALPHEPPACDQAISFKKLEPEAGTGIRALCATLHRKEGTRSPPPEGGIRVRLVAARPPGPCMRSSGKLSLTNLA